MTDDENIWWNPKTQKFSKSYIQSLYNHIIEAEDFLYGTTRKRRRRSLSNPLPTKPPPPPPKATSIPKQITSVEEKVEKEQEKALFNPLIIAAEEALNTEKALKKEQQSRMSYVIPLLKEKDKTSIPEYLNRIENENKWVDNHSLNDYAYLLRTFYNKDIKDKKEQTFIHVWNYTRLPKQGYLGYSRIISFVLVGEWHWITLVWNISKKQCWIFDSLSPSVFNTRSPLVNQLLNVLHEPPNTNAQAKENYDKMLGENATIKWSFKLYNEIQQSDGNSCGLFAAWFATFLMEHPSLLHPPEPVPIDAKKLRKAFVRSIREGTTPIRTEEVLI